MHEVLVNRLGGLSLPRKSVVRLTDRPDMTLDVYRGRKNSNTTTTIDVYYGRKTTDTWGSVIFAFKTTLTPTLNHITCINTFGEGFKKDAIRHQCSVKIALIANRVFSKTCLEVFIQVL